MRNLAFLLKNLKRKAQKNAESFLFGKLIIQNFEAKSSSKIERKNNTEKWKQLVQKISSKSGAPCILATKAMFYMSLLTLSTTGLVSTASSAVRFLTQLHLISSAFYRRLRIKTIFSAVTLLLSILRYFKDQKALSSIQLERQLDKQSRTQTI